MKHPLILLLFLAWSFRATLRAENQTITPREDPDVTLHNPDMGWVLYENYPLDPRPNGTGTMNVLPAAMFEGCDYVAVMFAWSDVERTAGSFDWTRVDEAWNYWQKRGKGIHLRISTEPLFGWCHTDPPGGMGVPEWLLARIPEEQKKRREDGAMFGWHVDARNPLYQERLRLFLHEVRARFTGPRTPALVDLRGFGRWGEWHSGFPYPTLDAKRAGLQAVLDIWSEAFPQLPLALSYSYDPDGPAELYAGPNNRFDPAFTKTYDDYLRFSAFDLALKKPNITLRRDGAGGAVHSNERKLCEYVYRELRRGPQAGEFLGGYAQVRRGGPAWVRWMVEDALSLHPNYIGLLGYSGKDALDFMTERPDLVAQGLRGMGYRLVPLGCTVPKTVRAGEPFDLEIEWINRAAGRALRDFDLRVRLITDGGNAVAAAEPVPLPTSEWLQNDKHRTKTRVIFPTIAAAGRAKLVIDLHDALTKRVIQLPLVKRAHDESCEIGEVTVLSN